MYKSMCMCIYIYIINYIYIYIYIYTIETLESPVRKADVRKRPNPSPPFVHAHYGHFRPYDVRVI